MEYVPYIAITAAFALVYLPRFVVLLEMRKLEGGYDNREPRVQQARLEGLGRRALAAHYNGFEAFSPFAIAVIIALLRGHLTATAYLSIAFIAARGAYVYAYLANRATLRSTAWAIGMIAISSLLFLAIIGR